MESQAGKLMVAYVRIKGIHVVKRKLATGEVREYRYHRATGTLLKSAPGTPAYLAEIAAAEAQVQVAPPAGEFRSIISKYKASDDLRALSPASRKDYDRYVRIIEEEFGTMPVAAVEDPQARSVFYGVEGQDLRDQAALGRLRLVGFAQNFELGQGPRVDPA